MEDVLDLYEEEYDARYPTVCFDEKLVAPEADVRPAEPMEPGQPERIDYEYERLGTANLFFFVEPLSGWRHVEMTDHGPRSTTHIASNGWSMKSIRMRNTFALSRII
jgi:hypothetical protein